MRKARTAWAGRAIGFGSAIVVGLVVSFFGPTWLHGTVRAVAVYDGAALAYLVAALVTVVQDDADLTRERAARADPGRNIVLLVVLVTVSVGFAAAIAILGKGPKVPTALERETAIGLAIASVVIGWSLIHTLFAFRYAHLYYIGPKHPPRLIFPANDTDPDDYDFLYYSFVIGMTYQVSDVSIADETLRRVTLGHALLSFAFNTSIIAFGVNLVTNLVH